jgi:hypothetical protein
MSGYHYCKRMLAPSGQRQHELLPVYGVCHLKDAHTDNIWLSNFPECTKTKLQKTTVTLFLKSFCYSVNQQEMQNLES